MSISATDANNASVHILGGAVQILAGVWAANSWLEPSPEGVLWGLSNLSAGAVFGASSYAVRVLVSKGLKEVLPLGDPKTTQTTRLVVAIASTLISMVGGFFALKMIGITLTAAVLVKMSVYPFISAMAMHLIMNGGYGDMNPANPSNPANPTIPATPMPATPMPATPMPDPVQTGSVPGIA